MAARSFCWSRKDGVSAWLSRSGYSYFSLWRGKKKRPSWAFEGYLRHSPARVRLDITYRNRSERSLDYTDVRIAGVSGGVKRKVMRMNYRLGLDIGVASVGWSVIEIDRQGSPTRVARAGVHLFEAGVDGGKLDPETAMTRGKEQSKATPRRDARAMRRQTWRRARRKKKVLGTLIRHGLLPKGDIRTPAAIDAYIKTLDIRLRQEWESDGTAHVDRQRLPYRLRAAAATKMIEKEEVGRALYHLAQRRGFLSNRRTPEKDGDESTMKQAIGELQEAIDAHDPPTLGAYLASLNPDEQRLRARWTSRAMYLHEFEVVWTEQAKNHALSERAKKELYDAIFFQRSLKDQRHLIGKCSLTGGTRAPIGLRVAQRFRLLQQVNHLRVIEDDLTQRPLRHEERTALLDALDRAGDLTFAKARQAAKLPRTSRFSIERGGEKKMIGNRTDAKLRKIFGERWEHLSEQEKDAVVEDVRSIRLPETLERRSRRHWGLDVEGAAALAALQLEEGHSAHSRAALEVLVAQMDDGQSYSEARRSEFPDSFDNADAHDELPPVVKWRDDIRNPSVIRALTEVRKVVNAIIARYGKPEQIHVELARDLKHGRSRREQISKRMRDREAERSAAAAAIIRDVPGIDDPRPWEIEKWLLAEECGWQCPFTGRPINAHTLVGRQSQFDVEHIWPFSQSLDNSFMNKTLCYHEENRNVKKRMCPSEAYSGDRFEDILERVRHFNTDRFTKHEKIRRFTEPVEEGFTARHLNETRYIGRLSCDYLGLLYGGRADTEGVKKIFTPSGGLVGWLRRGWGLNAVLSNSDEKERNDHRHHALDAIVIGLADDKAIKRLADAADAMEREVRERPFAEIEVPLNGLIKHVRDVADGIVVSHRQARKVRGKLHKDTLFSKPIGGKRRVRKELHKLTKADVDKGAIVDKRALAAIRAMLVKLGERDPAKAFGSEANRPAIAGGNGRPVRLRSVRVEVGNKPRQFGAAERTRWADAGANHHTRIVAVRDGRGEVVRWKDQPVVLADLMDRIGKCGRSTASDDDVLFTLAANEYLEMDAKDGDRRKVYRILNISAGDIEIKEHWDGRVRAEIQAAGERERVSGSALFERNARKVHVNHLGEVHNAGG